MELFPFCVNPDKKSEGNSPQQVCNNGKQFDPPLRVILAMGEPLPNAVMNAIKNTAIHTAMNIATAPIPRFQLPLRDRVGIIRG